MRAFPFVGCRMVVAGMARHAAEEAAQRSGWNDERVRTLVMGHGNAGEERLLLVPVPSIESYDKKQILGEVRRLLIVSTRASSPAVTWAQRTLNGEALVDESTGEVVALLAEGSPRESTFNKYLEPSASWTSVTPVVLPGKDDPGGIIKRLKGNKDSAVQRQLLERLARRREGLIRKALRHAGLADELVFEALIETRSTGWIAGVARADRYSVPQHLRDEPRLHVRITFPRPVAGPLCIGRGRFSGMGLLTKLERPAQPPAEV